MWGRMKSQKKQIGLSLIEILIALLILAAAFVTLLKFQGDLTRNIANIKQQLQAIALAQDKMNELRHYVAVNTSEGTPSYEQIASGNSTVTQGITTYSLVWTVTELTAPARKTVRIVVSWTNEKSQQESITLDGIIGEIDPKISGLIMKNL